MDAEKLRDNLVELLEGGGAHTTVREALEGLRPELRNARPREDMRSVYEQLEHLRIAQEDILRYTLDGDWKSPEWPVGYWPTDNDDLTEEGWKRTVSAFFEDLDEVVKMARTPSLDLTAPIPHGEGRTYLREILLVADHNAYHSAIIVQTRKLLGSWGD